MLAGFVLAGIALAAGAPSARADGAWLDAPLSNWNTPGMAIPRAPQEPDPGNPNCGTTVRSPETDEDSAVAAAGWKLVGAYQGGYGAKVITGTSGFDGMCRPVGYQVFVFYHQVFVGTISPEVMVSRTDGSETQVFLNANFMPGRAPTLFANFSRYTEQDALCCPSAISNVNYDIEFVDNGWVVVPKSVSTNPTERP